MTTATPLGTCLRMYELPALDFINAVTEIRRLATIIGQFTGAADEQISDVSVRERMGGTIAAMRDHLATIGDKSAWVAADRFHSILVDMQQTLTVSQARQHFHDIESRFADHLTFVRLFVIRSEQLPLLGTATDLLGPETADRFTSMWFDCEEAAKCICVWRPTASVFHCMRMLERAIRAFATKLGIPDPIKPAERNWGTILRTIKNKIDATYPADKRMSGSEGAFMESLYVTLDAVKNPWRNETMHVEGVYADAEARLIFINTLAFIQKMGTAFDENGDDVNPTLGITELR